MWVKADKRRLNENTDWKKTRTRETLMLARQQPTPRKWRSMQTKSGQDMASKSTSGVPPTKYPIFGNGLLKNYGIP